MTSDPCGIGCDSRNRRSTSKMVAFFSEICLNLSLIIYTLFSLCWDSGRKDRWGDRKVILINIKRTRLRYWNSEVKTEEPGWLAPSHLLFETKLQEQGDFKGYLPLFSSLICWQPTRTLEWEEGKKNERHVWQREVLKLTHCASILGQPRWQLHVLAPILAIQIHYLND
jgi:hypothetical protein